MSSGPNMRPIPPNISSWPCCLLWIRGPMIRENRVFIVTLMLGKAQPMRMIMEM